MKHTKAYLFLILTAIFWGLNFHFSKWILEEVGILEAGFWRYGVAILAFVLLGLSNWPSLQKLKAGALPIFITGFFGLFLFNVFFFLGIKHSSPVNASLIVALNPVTTVVVSHFLLKTKIYPLQVAGLIIALLGVSILVTRGQLGEILTMNYSKGEMIMIIANITFAFYHVWVKKYSGIMDNKSFTFLLNLVCLLCFVSVLPLAQVEGVFQHSNKFWLAALGSGVFSTTLGYYLWNRGVKEIGADKASIFANLVPLTAAIAGIFLGFQLEIYHYISGLVILTGIFISQLKGKGDFTKHMM